MSIYATLCEYANNDWPKGIPSSTVVVSKIHMSQAAAAIAALSDALRRQAVDAPDGADIHYELHNLAAYLSPEVRDGD